MFDKSKIGQSFTPFTIEVERGKIRELALALGDDNPIYQSRAAAQEAGYDDVPLFPTATTMFGFWGNTNLGGELLALGLNVMRILHGEEEYDYLAPNPTGRYIDRHHHNRRRQDAPGQQRLNGYRDDGNTLHQPARRASVERARSDHCARITMCRPDSSRVGMNIHRVLIMRD